jgi:hypothetical protein
MAFTGKPTLANELILWDGTEFYSGYITDSNISSTAAIAGTKISPNFGSQNISTTGTLTAAQSTLGSSTSVNSLLGSIVFTTKTFSSTGTIDTSTNDNIIYADTSGGAFTLTLPAPTNGRFIVLKDKKQTFNTNNLTLSPHGGEKIDGVASTLTLSSQNEGIFLTSDGTDWYTYITNTTGGGGGSVTWSNDLNGSSSTHQWVSSISGSGGSGGTVALNITALSFASGESSPTINQTVVSGTGSNAGQTLTIQAQAGQNVSTGTNNSGGNLILSSGSVGTGGTGGSSGNVVLETGGTSQLTVSPTEVTMASLAGGGSQAFVTVSTSGVLSTSLVLGVNAGGDLNGTYPDPYVSSLSGVGGTGNVIDINTSVLEWASSLSSVTLTQATTSTASGGTLNIRGRDTTFSGHYGADVTICGGWGIGGLGAVRLQTATSAGSSPSLGGSTDQLVVTSTSIALTPNALTWPSGTGYLQSNGTTIVQITSGTATVFGTLNQSGGSFSLDGNSSSSIVTTSSNALTITAGAASTWSTSSGALTLTSAATTTWSTSSGTLYIDSAQYLNLGETNAIKINIAQPGVNTEVNGSLTVDQATTLNSSLTQSNGAVSIAGNAASSIITTAGGLTITGAAASTWSTSAGLLTINGHTGIALQDAAVTYLTLTANQLQWAQGASTPLINQADAINNGTSLTINAQNAGGSGYNGGDLILSSGAKSTGGYDGYIYLEAGGNVEAFVMSADATSAGGLGIGTTPGSDPTITRGTGVPTTTQPNGSIFLRTDGTSSSTIYVREAGVWSIVSSSGTPSGAAGGDLSGTYPNPTIGSLDGYSLPSPTAGVLEEVGGNLVWGTVNLASSTYVSGILPTANQAAQTMGGDISGTTASATVIKVDGVSYPASPSTNTVPVVTASNTVTYQQIVDAQVSATAAIAGTKISPNFGSQNVVTTGTGSFGSTTVTSLQDTGLSTGVVHSDSSGNFTSSTIVDADISGSAAIEVSKLQAGTSAQILINNSTPTPVWATVSQDATINSSGQVTVVSAQGNFTVGGNLTVNGAETIVGTSTFQSNASFDGDVTVMDGYYLQAMTIQSGGSDVLTINGGGGINLQNGGITYFEIGTGGAGTIYVPSGVTLQATGTGSIIANSTTGGTAGGDLSGTYPNPTVAKINGSSVPAGGSLTTGNVLQVNGSSSLTYAPINLAGGSNYVTGVLPSSNQASQTMGGDISGTTASATVASLDGYTLPSPTPGVLKEVGGNLVWGTVNLASSTYVSGVLPTSNQANQSLTLIGDVTSSGGTTASATTTVVKINGSSVPAGGSLTTGNVLQVNGSSSLTYGAINLAGGSGYITGNLPTSNIAPGTSGQVLMSNGTPATTWTTLTGDVTVNATGGTTVNSISGSSPIDISAATLNFTGGTGNLQSNGTTIASITSSKLITIKGIRRNVTSVTASTYTALVTDDIIAADPTSNTIAITLPSSPTTGDTLVIKDITGQASTNSITVSPASGNIDGATSFVMDINYASITVVYTGAQWNIL